jgi:P4 family phage/plasmid primase-like protien
MTFLSDFLSKHGTKNKSVITHTRIGNTALNVYGGSYHIPVEERATFYELYCAHVFERGNKEYLTELQPEVGALAIDLDFRYKTPERKYEPEHIVAFIETVGQLLDALVAPPQPVDVYVFEKQEVNVQEDVIKDGIHLIFGIRLDQITKQMLYRRLLSKMGVWDDLGEHLTNTWDSVLDRGVFIGKTGWQLYGSRKPGNQAYRLTQIYDVRKVDGVVQSWTHRLEKFDITKRFSELTVQHAHFIGELRPEFKDEYDSIKTPKPVAKKVERLTEETAVDDTLETLFEDCKETTKLKETHSYVMCLPASYYDDYDKWIRVGWALKNTDERLFPSWVKFSSQSSKFSFDDVDKLKDQWTSWGKKHVMLTDRSIAFWARNENPTAYQTIRTQTLDYLVTEVTRQKQATEYDYAMVLHFMYKDTFACVSIRNKSWYEYIGQRWTETDSGTNLRRKISSMTGMYKLFNDKSKEVLEEVTKLSSGANPEKFEAARKWQAHCSSILIDLKRTDKKQNIMREACDLFYVPHFMDLLDSKNHVMCFTNGVIDFSLPDPFRQGTPEDYTSKCTNIPYVPLTEEHEGVVSEIKEFMRQLFPIKQLRDYMWAHAASTLMGKNTNQTFNIYTGSGRNGKSKFVELMGKALGEYKATVPVTLITQKRTSIGGTSSEIVQLRGVRYAVMQEPSVGDTINEGIMKELTGGDPLQGRALFKDSVTFTPQFKLVVCTNTPFDFKSTDDGTWRRIRMCEFMSLFTEEPVEGDEIKPYQFKVDKNIDDKFESWKTVFMSMLVEKAVKTQGDVVDCPIVLAKSQEYREDQDNLAEYVKSCFKKEVGGRIRWVDVSKHLNVWWSSHKGGAEKPPSAKVVQAYLSRCFGPKIDFGGVKNAWGGVALVQTEVEGDPEA